MVTSLASIILLVIVSGNRGVRLSVGSWTGRFPTVPASSILNKKMVGTRHSHFIFSSLLYFFFNCCTSRTPNNMCIFHLHKNPLLLLLLHFIFWCLLLLSCLSLVRFDAWFRRIQTLGSDAWFRRLVPTAAAFCLRRFRRLRRF